ncbi:hypothetical protein BC831DRAFT_484710 [Entophlyctis helioformis]|nr:hypothetical protein BC831DRAFT_484710 [Entophlyctis helioformis]
MAGGIVAADVYLLVCLLQMPLSTYITGLRATCMAIPPCILLMLAITHVPASRSPLTHAISTTLLYAIVSVFLLTQLEFLMVLVPYFSSISRAIIVRIQKAVAVMSVLYIVAAWRLWFPESLHFGILAFAGLWALLGGIYNVGQQCLLLFCVLFKLKGATPLFKAGYAALVLMGCLFMVVCMASAALVRDTNSSNLVLILVMNLCIPAFTVCSVASMEILRQALSNSRRPTPSPKQRPSRSARLSRLRNWSARASATVKQTHLSSSPASGRAPTSTVDEIRSTSIATESITSIASSVAPANTVIQHSNVFGGRA